MKNIVIKLLTMPLFIFVAVGVANMLITLELDNFWFWNWGTWMQVVCVVWYLTALTYFHHRND